jgi:excisionase family DNA binding protein
VTERLLTARKVAEFLDVSTETVLRWTRQGKLPAVRLPGGAIRYLPDTLDGWLLERATGASDAPREVSPTRNATRPQQAYGAVTSDMSPTPLRPVARTEED